MRRQLDVSFPNAPIRADYNIFLEALGIHYDVRVVPAEHAEVVFASDSTDESLLKKPITFFVSVELWWPRFSKFDYSLGFLHLRHPRYFRLPCYALEFPARALVKSADFADRVLAEPREFCSFVVSNANPRRTFARIHFFQTLNARKRVNSGGSAFNNIGKSIGQGEDARQAFIGQHRFHIAFENKRWKGYVTEKLPAAMAAGAIPIYWGCPDIGQEFNPRSFIRLERVRDSEEVCRQIVAVANDRDQMAKILREPWFHDNRPNAAYDVQALGEWLHWAIRTGKQPRRTLFPGELLYKKYEILRGRLASYSYRLQAAKPPPA